MGVTNQLLTGMILQVLVSNVQDCFFPEFLAKSEQMAVKIRAAVECQIFFGGGEGIAY